MSHHFARLLAIATVTLLLATPAPCPACGNSGEDVRAQAEQAITWAASLVEWHKRRKVDTASTDDAPVLNLHGRVTEELAAARAQYAAAMYDNALGHARTVSELLDN